MAGVAPVGVIVSNVSCSGMEMDFIDARVRMIDCTTSGTVSSRPNAATAQDVTVITSGTISPSN